MCAVTDDEFELAKAFGEHVVVPDELSGGREIALAFPPREGEWPSMFDRLRRYGVRGASSRSGHPGRGGRPKAGRDCTGSRGGVAGVQRRGAPRSNADGGFAGRLVQPVRGLFDERFPHRAHGRGRWRRFADPRQDRGPLAGDLRQPIPAGGRRSRLAYPPVVEVARAIYDGPSFDRLPALAEALEDAGCGSEALLAHCRGGGAHVRGCWAVDLILGIRRRNGHAARIDGSPSAR
jgi:hypothetical protein